LLATYQNLSLYNVGLIPSGFFTAYALGQFLHGQISERYNPFIYIAIGLLGSAFFNILLGFTAGFFWLLFIFEVCDGFMQSMGWSSCVRANSLIQNKEHLEKSSIVLGTSYQVGNSIAWLGSAFAVGTWGWQAGFWVAAVMLFLRGITLLLFKPNLKIEAKPKPKEQIKRTLSKPIVLSGISLSLLNMVRYGVIIWIPLYLFTSENLVVSQMGNVGLKVCLIPILGVIGTLYFYKKSKWSVDMKAILFLIGLCISFIIFPFVRGLLALLVLLMSSFFLYGPHVYLVTTIPSRMKDKNVVAASAGFIDGMGYIGTVLIGIIIPLLISVFGSWTSVFIFWAVLSAIVAVFISFIHLELKQ
ncbi:MAG: MFS transporter, partial [Promethearchaeota archaeon]